MKYQWNDEARNFVELYNVDRRLIVDAVRAPQMISTDPRSAEVGYPIKRLRRGDVEVVVGYREPEYPTILYVRLATPDDDQGPKRSPGGTKGSSLPPTLTELHRRITMAGYSLEHSGMHVKVLSQGGNLLMTLPKTPSDKRSLANAWHEFLRVDRAAKETQKGLQK